MTSFSVRDRPVWQWSAYDLSDAIRRKHLSAAEALEEVLRHIADVNPRLNAIVDDTSAEARHAADVIDASGASSNGLLSGVPVTVKDIVDQAGRPNTNGVAAYAGNIAARDAPVVASLRASGALIVGRTNTPEFSLRGTTVNELHGRTYNPWNDWASAGGSSGGAAAAVMAGMGPLAHGTDIGGSLRHPAAATGAVTVKPGLGRIPAYNPSAGAERGILAQLMSVQGVIAREVRDVRLGMRALLRRDPHDPWMVALPLEREIVRPTRVAFTRNMVDVALHPSVERALDKARAMLEQVGYTVVDIDPPDIRETSLLAYRALFGEFKSLGDDAIRAHGSATVNAILDTAYAFYPPLLGNELLKGIAERAAHMRRWSLFLEEYPLVLTPYLPSRTFSWNRDAEGVEGFRDVDGSAYYACSVNFLGLPAGIISPHFEDGMPVAVQIIGNCFCEDMILDAMEAVERQAGVMAERLWSL